MARKAASTNVPQIIQKVQRTSDSLNEGLPIKITREKF